MAISKAKLERLAPLLEGGGPSSSGWWAMHCPYHDDRNRSAGLNVDEGYFYCQVCMEHRTVAQLLKDEKDWNVVANANNNLGSSRKPKETVTEANIEAWHANLLSNRKRLTALLERRGLSIATIRNYEIGWDPNKNAYTIPIRDSAGTIKNIRRYQLDVPDERRKIWSVEGMGDPVLYPVDQLDNSSIVICEGEWDAMITIQHGIPAITRTGAADVWKSQWSHAFKDKTVYLCHDMDDKGQLANVRVRAALEGVARKVVTVKLPFEVTTKHGKDLTDFFLEGGTRQDFIELIREAQLEEEEEEDDEPEDDEPEDDVYQIGVMDSFDAGLVERPIKMSVTVIGRQDPVFVIPERIKFACVDVGSMPKCKKCEFVERGSALIDMTVKAQDPLILKLMGVSEDKVLEVLSKHVGIVPKCTMPKSKIESYRTVQEVYVRPSLDAGPSIRQEKQDFTHRRIISSSSHDLTHNEAVVLTGTIRPSPKNQANEFQAWSVDRPETILDRFVVEPLVLEEMQGFKTDDPLKMMERIADDLSAHHSRVFGRQDFHMFADIVFHSVLELPMPGERNEKGWIDAIAVGDTRTGKSETSRALLNLYGSGEFVNCEAASFAGVVGGLDKFADGRFVVKWGSIPTFDRRIVILDEVSGLRKEQIAQMSDMRASGKAQLTKIHTEEALARTRLLWLGNPRKDGMDSVAYGIDALRDLIGNPEDIARFDMAMGIFSDDVSLEEINRYRPPVKNRLFSDDAYRGVLRWAWTRRRQHIKWGRGANEMVRQYATDLGKFYIDNPNLLGEGKKKIARISAAIAARTFSTPDGEALLIQEHHVDAAVEFLDRIYGHRRFGYKVVSQQRLADRKATRDSLDEIMSFLATRPHLTRFLLNSPVFSKFHMQSLLNVSDDEAGVIIAGLWERKAVEMHGSQIRLSPIVLDQLRGTRFSDV